MKRELLLLLNLVYFQFLFSQLAFMPAPPFVSEENTWFDSNGTRHTFSADSFLVDGFYYRKELYSSSEFGNDFKETKKLYRQQGQKVYSKASVSKKEKLIYNHALNKDDIFYLKPLDFDSIQMKVEEVDSILLLDGSLRKRIKVQCDPEKSGFSYDWIEGIGSTQITDLPCLLDGGGSYLTCFYTNGQHIFKTYEPWLKDEKCFFTTAVSDLDKVEIIVYPNPISSRLNLFIENSLPKAPEIILYDILGKEAFKAQLTLGLNNIDLIYLSAGSYRFKVVDKSKVIAAGMLVKI
jgi:hypothetical protein